MKFVQSWQGKLVIQATSLTVPSIGPREREAAAKEA